MFLRKINMSIFMFKNISQKFNNFSPRDLSYVLVIWGVALIALLYFPVQEVFAGQWQLYQKVDLFNLPTIEILGNTIPIGVVSVRYYSLCILTGVICGYLLTLYLAARHFVVASVIDRMLVGLVVFGLAGARLFYVSFNWEQFQNNLPNIIFGLSQGGLAIFGAMIVGIIYLIAYVSQYKFNFFEFIDFLAPGLLLGQILGRWGNWFNYESYGPATSVLWKMYVPIEANVSDNLNSRFFHPTFLYEILANYLLLIFILYKYDGLTRKNAGLVGGYYCVGYGTIRFFCEFFRLDALKFDLGRNFNVFGYFSFQYLAVSQLMACILFCFGLIILAKRSRVIYLKRNMSEVKI